jgi:hypothetical protein
MLKSHFLLQQPQLSNVIGHPTSQQAWSRAKRHPPAEVASTEYLYYTIASALLTNRLQYALALARTKPCPCAPAKVERVRANGAD